MGNCASSEAASQAQDVGAAGNRGPWPRGGDNPGAASREDRHTDGTANTAQALPQGGAAAEQVESMVAKVSAAARRRAPGTAAPMAVASHLTDCAAGVARLSRLRGGPASVPKGASRTVAYCRAGAARTPANPLPPPWLAPLQVYSLQQELALVSTHPLLALPEAAEVICDHLGLAALGCAAGLAPPGSHRARPGRGIRPPTPHPQAHRELGALGAPLRAQD